jgi:hypothetical protein
MRNLLRLWTIGLFFVIIGASTAHADTITYTFTGEGIFSGTDWTYVDSSGYLPRKTVLPSSDLAHSTDVYLNGVNYGAITSVSAYTRGINCSSKFYSRDQCMDITSASGATIYQIYAPGDLLSMPSTKPYHGVISGSGLSITATPEPSSATLMLSGIGLLGLMVVMRKRIPLGNLQAS